MTEGEEYESLTREVSELMRGKNIRVCLATLGWLMSELLDQVPVDDRPALVARWLDCVSRSVRVAEETDTTEDEEIY